MKFTIIYTTNCFGSRRTFIHDNKNKLLVFEAHVCNPTQLFTFYLYIFISFHLYTDFVDLVKVNLEIIDMLV